MKKITITVILALIVFYNLDAQYNYFTVTSTSTGAAPYVMQDNSTDYVGIGISATNAGSLLGAPLSISNDNFSTHPSILGLIGNLGSGSPFVAYSAYSFAVLRGDISSSGGPTIDFTIDGNGQCGIGALAANFNNVFTSSAYSGTLLGVTDPNNSSTTPLFTVATNTNNPTGYNLAALTVDWRGYSSLGGYFTGATPNPAHLFLTDPNPSGTDALMDVVTNASTQSLYIAANGYVGIGNYPGIGSSSGGGIGPPPVPGNGISNAHLFIFDPTGDGQPLLVTGVGSGAGLVVSSSNTVGIGTLTPLSALDVSGSISAGTYAGANPAPTNGMIISGPVGIGTSAPVGKLDVVGSAYVSGNVGIGTTSPANKLDVVGNASISGQVGIGTTSPSSGAALDVQGGVVRIGGVSLSNNWSSSNTSGYSLYIQGGVLAEKYKCALHTTSDWSDYVFDKGYKLKSLSEVESYIAQKHHLPDVPSAEDVQCDGIDMAKMDATLLKKIEELTLYVLQLKKDNEVMKAEISNLKK